MTEEKYLPRLHGAELIGRGIGSAVVAAFSDARLEDVDGPGGHDR